MNEVQVKRLEFLEETIKFYNSNNRATSGGSCVYGPTDTSVGCAIGRHMDREEAIALDHLPEKFNTVENLSVWNAIPTEIQLLGMEFLKEVQELHDDAKCWGPEGLSNKGKDKATFIKAQFIDNEEQA